MGSLAWNTNHATSSRLVFPLPASRSEREHMGLIQQCLAALHPRQDCGETSFQHRQFHFKVKDASFTYGAAPIWLPSSIRRTLSPTRPVAEVQSSFSIFLYQLNVGLAQTPICCLKTRIHIHTNALFTKPKHTPPLPMLSLHFEHG